MTDEKSTPTKLGCGIVTTAILNDEQVDKLEDWIKAMIESDKDISNYRDDYSGVGDRKQDFVDSMTTVVRP